MTAKELRNWVENADVRDIDNVLEYLFDKDCLNEEGKKLRNKFWKEYIRDEKSLWEEYIKEED